MSIVRQIWAEHELVEKHTWKKPMLPFAMRLKKAEANLQRRLKKHVTNIN